jgi:16S rRNA C967 or C1407 C5-methylase (RsmB/RsmF family)
MSYSSITDAIRKKKENEKNRIVRRFENLTKDEVEIENMRKKYKLDEWNVGQQRGLFVYDAKVSERERMEQEAEEAIAIEKHGLQNEDVLESIEEVGDEEEPEDVGIGSLKPNFYNGQFYSDDESDDDFGDDA